MPTLGEFVPNDTSISIGAPFDSRGRRGPKNSRISGATIESSLSFPAACDSDRLTKNQVESLCARLGIPKEDFGL